MLKQDHYALLGISREADTTAIERACAGALSVTSDSAERARLRHARETLCSPARRAIYDRSLRTIPTPVRGLGTATAKPNDTRSAVLTPPQTDSKVFRQRWWLLGLAAAVAIAGGIAYYFFSIKPRSAGATAASTTGPTTNRPAPTAAKPAVRSTTEPRRPTGATGTTGTTGSDPGLDPESVVALAAPSVLVLEALGRSGAVTSRASAVVIAPETIVTHCQRVQYAAAVRVRSGGNEFTALPAITDNTLELCTLRVPGLNAPTALRGGNVQVKVGQAVLSVGAPNGSARPWSQGQISGLRDMAGITVIQTTANAPPWASGGGLFDAEGRLIGITIHQHKLVPGQNLALPVDLLNTLRNR